MELLSLILVIYILLLGAILKSTYAADYAKSIDELDALCGFKCLATDFPTVNWQCGTGGNSACLCYTSTTPQSRCTDPKICKDAEWTGIDTGPDGIKFLSLISNPTTAVPSVGSMFTALTALKELKLNDFHIQGTLPSLNTPALIKLYLRNNLLTGIYILNL